MRRGSFALFGRLWTPTSWTRPITGWGLGRFRYALQGRYSFDELVSVPALRNFWDARDVVIELAVVVGIPGLILFGGFAWCAGRGCTPAVVVAAGAIVFTWVLQRISLQTLPIVMARRRERRIWHRG